MSEPHAERALRTATSRYAHRMLGLTPLRPEAAAAPGGLAAGQVVLVDCGAVNCRLVPRGTRADAADAA